MRRAAPAPPAPEWLLWLVGGTEGAAPSQRGRLLGWTFVAAPAATAGGLAGGAASPGALAAAAAADLLVLCAGVLLLLRRSRELGDRTVQGLLVAGTAWACALVYLAHAGGGLDALLCWSAPVAFGLLPPRRAAAQLGLAAAAAAALLVATRPGGAGWSGGVAARWSVLAATLAVLSLVAGRLARALGQRDELLRGAFDQWPLAMSVTDSASRWLAVNPAASALLGRAPEELAGRPVAELVHPDDAPASEAARRGLAEGQAATSVQEERYLRPDGSIVHALTTLSALRAGPRDEVVLLGLSQDLTQQRRAEGHRLHLVRQLLRAQEQERARIADDVHDDPLQSVIAVSIQLQMLASRVDDPALVPLVASMQRSTATSIEQLRELLFELHPPALQLGGLVESLHAFLRRYDGLDGPKVTVERRLEGDPAPEEAIVLFRVAREALANAHKHAAAREIAVVVEDDEEGIAVVVTDDGVGFDPGDVHSRPGHLGLASARERTERVGGSLEVESAPGEGTCVRAWIPRLRR